MNQETPLKNEEARPQASESDEKVYKPRPEEQELFEIFRVLVLLYENLRYHLIKIIDEYIDVDS